MARRTATFSLLPSVKKEWLKALRSGKYKQGEGVLYSRGSFCCLGVLCKVLGTPEHKMTQLSLPQNVGVGEDITPSYEEARKVSYDPEEYAWSVLYNGKLTPLSVLNDGDTYYGGGGKIKRLSFEKIADIIERRVPTHK